jgi:APA family basic amino acid/polyamine antiporter
MANLMRRKSLEFEVDVTRRLKPTLSWYHLLALGVGAIVGTGIYTLTGVGVARAGPAIVLAFALVGVVCACVALAYSELSTLIPASGSAYTYTYVILGEALAWVVGWSLILEYSLVVSAVAVGWSGYAAGFLHGLGLALPNAIIAGPHMPGGLINIPAIFIIAVVTGVLLLGTKESATVNAILVCVKIAALVLFVAVALPHFSAANFHPFMPYGFNKHTVAGGERGVMAGAAIVFFAFYGFDAISTAAEESKRPGRDLTVGILGAMTICTILYMFVATTAVGALAFGAFANSPEPLALILRELHQPIVAEIVAAAVVIGVPTVILAFLYGQTRIFFVMARDGLLPRRLSILSPKSGVPVLVTVLTAIVVSVLAGLFRLDEIAALANAGTLCAFIAVCVSMMVFRIREPNRPRVFRTPVWWLVGTLGTLGCLYLFTSLPLFTIRWFFIWNAIGLVLYLLFAQRSSRLAQASSADAG